MEGYILLGGGAEFGGQMAEPDRRAIELAGGPDVPISIIPTAAAFDHNEERAGYAGVHWFEGLGAKNVASLPLIDKNSANDTQIAEKIRQSKLIYMTDGSASSLYNALANSASWQAIIDAYANGTVLGGSAAGAMILCQYFYDPAAKQVARGLGLVPNACLLPHFDNFGKGWAKLMSVQLPQAVLIGIDELTAIIDDGSAGRKIGWHVYGKGSVTIYRLGEPTVYKTGDSFNDDFLVSTG